MQLARPKPPPVLALEFFLACDWSARIALLQGWTYRVGIFGAINLLDDPAWLALMFC